MWGRRGSWESSSERERGLDLDGTLELSKDSVGGEVKNLSIEDGTILENLKDLHLIEERMDLQLIKESSLGTSNLHTSEDNLLGGNDINLGLNNLGLDLESLEHSGLLWVKSSWSGWDPHIIWGNHTWLGWGWSHLIVEDCFNLRKISVGEDKVDVTLELIHDLLKVWVWLPCVLSFLVVFISWLWLSVKISKSGLHEGVFTHDHNSIDLSQTLSQLGDLLGGNVLWGDEKNILVLLSDLLESEPVGLLLNSLI